MIKYLSLFSGIGAFEKALERNGIKYELVGFSEIDKYAIESYCAVHNVDPSLNLGDISKIDITTLPNDIDLITHGSPCQDFSVAGKQAGGDKGSGTRSSLMWCTVDIVGQTRPRYVVWENVKNLLSAKNRHNFDSYINIMSELGYNSYYQVLNAKNYGIPQNRERVFTISIRSDVDKFFNFEFPEKQELKLKLKDILEAEVDEKYYLDDEKIEKIKSIIQEKDCCDTILSRDWKDPKCIQVGELDIKGHDCVKRVYSGEGLAPTLTDMQGGNRQPKIMIVGNYMPSGHDAGRIVDEEGIAPTVKENHGTVTAVATREHNYFETQYNKFLSKNGYFPEMFNPYNTSEVKEVAPTLSTACGCTTSSATVLVANTEETEKETESKIRIRKLTPRECWRLMGFDDEDFETAKAVPMSNTQLYKQAGNSIVVNVLEAIFKKMRW